MGLLQSATGQQDQADSFVPRLLAAGGAVLIFGMWLAALATNFCYQLWAILPELGH